MQSASLLLLLFSTEFSPLLVGTKDPVPPVKGASVVTIEVAYNGESGEIEHLQQIRTWRLHNYYILEQYILTIRKFTHDTHHY